MNMNQGNSISRKIEILVFRLIPFIFFLVLTIYFIFFNNGELSQNSFAQFGDYFGGILNPILSFLAVMMLMVSIRLQSDELSETRRELIETKDIHRENLEIAKENIRSQENLFALQVVSTEVKELVDHVSETINITSSSKYTIYENGEMRKEYLSQANMLDESDMYKVSNFDYEDFECFLSEYNFVLASLSNDLRSVRGFLIYAEERSLESQLMPMYSIRKIISKCMMVQKRSEKVIKALGEIPMAEELHKQFHDIRDEASQLSLVIESVKLKMVKR